MSDQPPFQPPSQPPTEPPTQPPTQDGTVPSFSAPPLPPPGQFSSPPPPPPPTVPQFGAQFGDQPATATSAPLSAGNNGVATAALITGIIGLLTFFICGLGALLGIVAAVLGFVGLSNSKKLIDSRGKGQAIAGIITGSLAVLATIGLFVIFVLLGAVGSGDVNYGVDSGTNSDTPDGVCDATRYVQDPDC